MQGNRHLPNTQRYQKTDTNKKLAKNLSFVLDLEIILHLFPKFLRLVGD